MKEKFENVLDWIDRIDQWNFPGGFEIGLMFNIVLWLTMFGLFGYATLDLFIWR